MPPDDAVAEVEVRPLPERRPGRDWTASVVGVLVFVGGVGALAWVFLQAYHLYTLPSDQLIRVGTKALDLQELLRTTSAVIVKIILLVVMALAASLVAGKGVHLYSSAARRQN